MKRAEAALHSLKRSESDKMEPMQSSLTDRYCSWTFHFSKRYIESVEESEMPLIPSF